MKKPKDFEYLIDAFRSLPSVGTKNANRFSHYIIKMDEKYVKDFAQRLINAKNNIMLCKYCHNISSSEICNICNNKERHKTICIVSNIEDLERIEESNSYYGYYHILHGELNRKNNADSLFLNDLENHIDEYEVKEVIIACTFSYNGEITSEYIKNLLSNKEVSIYRIGLGLPMNSSIDYADDETLKQSLLNKKIMNS